MLQIISKVSKSRTIGDAIKIKNRTVLIKLSNVIVLGLCLFCFCSCNKDARLVKKFIVRMNAKEVNAASKYIYPADHASLYFFNEEILNRTPNLFFKIVEMENVKIEGESGIALKIECKNVSQFFENYMRNLNMIDVNNCIVDTFFVKETGKGRKITFGWSKIKGENLYLASIDEKQSNVTFLNIRSGKSEKNTSIGKLTMGKKIVIDEFSEDPDWVQCYTIDHTCNIVHGHIKKSLALTKESLFFSLGVFEGLSLLIAVIILVVIAFPILYIGNISKALFGAGIGGILTCIAMVLGLIYAVYQLLENILFELFLINLPY